jgi:septum formation protein
MRLFHKVVPVTLILASASAIRHQMLEQAGIEFAVAPASVDEGRAKKEHSEGGALSLALAEAKARTVSCDRPADWVIGSDSVVSVGGRLFNKPADRDQATDHLRFFSGKPMILSSAAALARGGTVEWSTGDSATLLVRELSEGFIQEYLDAEWPEVGYCVGVFRLEGRGVQLFESIEGSYFTILGMPLLPLLSALRGRGLMGS